MHQPIMSIFSRFKRVKKNAEKDKKAANGHPKISEPMSPQVPASVVQEWPLAAAPTAPMPKQKPKQRLPIPVSPTTPSKLATNPVNYSPEEAKIRIAAIKRTKSEMSLRGASPPGRFYSHSQASNDSFEPPFRPVHRVRSDMSLRVPVAQEPARPKTSSGSSTRSRVRYLDNYSFYAHNQPLREFRPMASSRSVSAPQQAPRPKTCENCSITISNNNNSSSSNNSGRRSRRVSSMKRPSLLDLTMEEEPYHSSSSRYSVETTQSSITTSPPLPNTKIRRFSRMRSLPALRLKKPPPAAIVTNISSPYYQASDFSATHQQSNAYHYYSSGIAGGGGVGGRARSQKSPRSPKSPLPSWRYEDYDAAPPVPVLSSASSVALGVQQQGVGMGVRRNVSRRASFSSMFSRRNGSAVMVG